MKEIVNIQYELKAPKEENSKYFKYRTAEGILEVVKPLLKQYGLYILLSDDITTVGGSKYFVKSTAGLYNTDGTLVAQTTACAEIEKGNGMSAAQSTGASSSYARKYALCGLFAIDDSKNDPDTLPSTQQAIEANDYMQKHENAFAAYCTMFNHTKLDEFSQEELVEIYVRLKQRNKI